MSVPIYQITTPPRLDSKNLFKILGANIPLLPPGFDENIESQGELILQESFQVWDPKTLIRKGRERHLFLFEMSLVFSKEVKDSNGRSKYIYKSKLFVSRSWWNFFLFFASVWSIWSDVHLCLTNWIKNNVIKDPIRFLIEDDMIGFFSISQCLIS